MLQIWSIFDLKKKLDLILISFLVFINTALEAISISFFIPVVVSLTNNNLAEIYPQFAIIMDYFSNKFSTTTINSSIILFTITIILKNLFQLLINYKEIRFTILIQEETSQRLFNKYLNNDYSFHLKNRSSDLLTKVRNQTKYFSDAVSSIYGMFSEIILISGLAFLLLLFAFEVTLISLCIFSILSYIFVKILNKYVVRASDERNEMEFKKTRIVQESILGVREILMSNIKNQVIEQYRNCSNIFAKSISIYSLISKVPKIYFEIIIVILIATALYVSTNILKDFNLNIVLPVLTLYAATGFRLLPAANRFVNYIQRYRFAYPTIGQVYEELNNETKNITVSKKLNIKKIEIKNLSFSYPKPSKKILDEINLTINSNEKILIYGSSGSGKSTFLDLIIGLQFPNEGKIVVNENQETNKNFNLINSISYVSQKIFIFNKSLKENICLNPNEFNQEKFDKILEITHLKDLNSNLSNSSDYKDVDFDSVLSGGQKQRIMIARALYKSDDFILMDEPTSSLDTKTAEEIMINITKRKNISLIMVTHDNSLSKYFDRVIEIKDSHLIEHTKK